MKQQAESLMEVLIVLGVVSTVFLLSNATLFKARFCFLKLDTQLNEIIEQQNKSEIDLYG